MKMTGANSNQRNSLLVKTQERNKRLACGEKEKDRSSCIKESFSSSSASAKNNKVK